MDRKEYLNLCRIAAMNKAAWKELPKVKYGDIEYIPVAYELGFSSAGAVTHKAILLDKNQNCIMKCPLDRVEAV